MTGIRAFDMFCGGGGSSLGAQQADVRIVGAVDLWKPAAQAFALNFPEAVVYNADLRGLDPTAVMKKVGQVDLLMSSPECTHHTCARGNRPALESSRETALEVIRWAKLMKPRWVVLENVVHMRPWARYDDLKQGLSQCGYMLREQVIDASELGVAQKRRRLFLIGDLYRQPSTVVMDTRNPAPARSILDPDGTWPTTSLRRAGRASATLARAERAISSLPPDSAFLMVYYGSDGSGGWQSLDAPLRTVTTVDRFALVTPSPGGHVMRMLQPRELRRAMGFPDTYRFPDVTRRDKVKLLGNAVCSPVMKAIVGSLTGAPVIRRSASPRGVGRARHSGVQSPQEEPVAA